MNRGDYALIAAAVHRTGMAYPIGRKSQKEKEGAAGALRLVAIDLAANFAHENPEFDKRLFLSACGVSP